MENSGLQHKLWQCMQTYRDKAIPHIGKRWIIAISLLLLYTLRVVTRGGYYVVSYCLAIFILNLFLGFLTPISSDMEDEDFDNPVLPIRESDEYKPFIRKLGEFNFWRSTVIGTGVAIICTFVDAFDIMVFWPILVIYFVVLFIATMRRQIAHMYKHGYLPFDIGKAKYTQKA